MDVQIDLSGIELETERLLLRPWLESDLEDFYAYASVPGVGEMAGWRHHESREISKEILAAFIADRNVLAVVHRGDARAIGSIGLHPSCLNDLPEYAPLRQKEIGYVLSRDYWGCGLMPEAVRAVLLCCFQTLGLEAVAVGHFTENAQSRRLIEKCGFRYVRTGIYHAEQLGRDFEEPQYVMTAPPIL